MAVGEVMASKECIDVGIMARIRTGSSELALLNNNNNNNNEDGILRPSLTIEECGGTMVEADSSEREVDGNMRIIYVPQTVYFSGANRHAYEPSSASAGPAESGVVSKWRMKDRMKTGYVALVLCLNIGVDPPDIIKISPCARIECWIDPFSMSAQKAIEAIGRNLQAQYERWQPRAKYKLQLDPTVEELKRLCSQCRKSAKLERVLFHYNGHGVPKPTINGEIWLFNRTYTQYIPLSVYELESWLGTPSIYVFDCSSAGMILNAFCEHPEWGLNSSASSATKDCILLAACGANEILPQHAELPADVFTACLTTPIKVALRWFCPRSLLKDSLDPDLIDQIPGRQNDRKTPLGELNWIFTAITDTIAWNVLPRELFQKLFRQDLLVASLFRNFILAERIMRAANCSPLSYPRLPPTHQHPMWYAWDMAAEMCLAQLPGLLKDSTEFKASPFFSEQLTAFEVWLNHGSERKKPPEQLPIVLQVLLSQSHRFRALVLLGRFLDMGAWAVDLALSVGIFPYVLKLLQTTAAELRQILVFIWTKILALDKSCQVDLVKDNGHQYFIKFLDSPDIYAEQQAMAAFVLTVIVDGHRRGQEECLQCGLVSICLQHIQTSLSTDGQRDTLLLKWLCLCLGKLWEGFDLAQQQGLQASAPAILMQLLSETQPEVRAAATFALGTLIAVGSELVSDSSSLDDDHEDEERHKAEQEIASYLLKVLYDGSPLVRVELAIGLSRFAIGHNKLLKPIAAAYLKPPSNSVITSLPTLTPIRSTSGNYSNAAQMALSGSSVALSKSAGLRLTTETMPVHISFNSPSLQVSSLMQGSPSTEVSKFLENEKSSNGDLRPRKQRTEESSFYVRCVSAMYTLGRDPFPHVAGFGRQVLRNIGVEPVVVNPVKVGTSPTLHLGSGSGHQRNSSIGAMPPTVLSSLPRSFSWIDSPSGNSTVTFRTPPASPPTGQSVLTGTGMRRVCSLEFSPHLRRTAESGLAGSALVGGGPSPALENVTVPSSNLYKWSSGHFARPLLELPHDDDDDSATRRTERQRLAMDGISKCEHSNITRVSDQIASFDIESQSTSKAVLLHPFIPIVCSADENEVIRIWDYEEGELVNMFDNHKAADKGVSRMCVLNELDDSLLLVASSDGCVRIWKDYTQKGTQHLVTGWQTVQGHKPGVRSMNAVMDWQQFRGFLYASGEVSSIAVWDLNSEMLAFDIPSQSDSTVSSLSASQGFYHNVAAGYYDGSVRVFDIRSKNLACITTLHSQKVVNVDFLPGLHSSKIVSASGAGDLKFIDMRKPETPCLEVDTRSSLLSAMAVHRHAPFIACGSAKQVIKVFNFQGEQLSVIRYHNSFLGQRIGPVSSLGFHPYKVYLAAGATDSNVSIYSGDSGLP